MKRTASVVELKAKLSEHLRQVKSGHELIVTERGIPVARMLPLDDSERRSTRRVRLTRSGALKPGQTVIEAFLQQAREGHEGDQRNPEPHSCTVAKAAWAHRDWVHRRRRRRPPARRSAAVAGREAAPG